MDATERIIYNQFPGSGKISRETREKMLEKHRRRKWEIQKYTEPVSKIKQKAFENMSEGMNFEV